jgi:adenosylcobinamide kinase/adenosylcobinamide-phosphate guanylyltransferase
MTTLVLGGAASGKSEYAERLAETAHAAGRETPLWYIATMAAPDDESRERVRKHRDRRAGKGYETVECPDGDALAAFAEQLDADAGTVVLLDDFGNLAANELFAPERVGEALEPMTEEQVTARVNPLVQSLEILHRKAGTLVLVTNDVFGDGPSDDPGVDNYLRCLAALDRMVAAFSDNVCEVTAGLADYIKGGEPV